MWVRSVSPSLPTTGLAVPAGGSRVWVRGVVEIWIPENKAETPFKWYLAKHDVFLSKNVWNPCSACLLE